MPEELRDKLAERARTANRSLNAEIIAILQEDVGKKSIGLSEQDVEAMAELIAHKVAARLRQNLDSD